ncbi:nuclease-related domain-containing protein [Alkalihalophilus sp. As8PL]|uniref:Nuclease-related domain-containing protein n=1 Tax=Alkalihalophilus sp. As8PL TaxID=3237103 RepID=A0AB39BYA4_9BACI
MRSTSTQNSFPPPETTSNRSRLSKKESCYKGESALDYHLSFLPQKEYVIFHDLRLQSGDYFFQIDTLILTPNYILLIEVKHLFGTLTFEPEFQQLVRSTADAEDVFPDPITQVKRQASQLKTFLGKHKIPDIPLETLVVFTNSLSRITLSDSTTYTRRYVIRDTVLLNRIEQLSSQYITITLDPKLVKKVTRILNNSHTPSIIAPLQAYNLQPIELIKGVHCPKCNAIPMRRLHGKWFCSSCYYQSKVAHINSLVDYRLLLSDTITNKQACEFLKITRPLACRVLTALETAIIGVKKGRKYKLELDNLKKLVIEKGID